MKYLNMLSPWDLNLMASVIRERREDTEKTVWMWRQKQVNQPQAKEHLGLPEAKRGKEESSPQRERSAANTFISALHNCRRINVLSC